MKIILTGLALALAALAFPAGATCQLNTLANLHVTLLGARPTIHAKLNGKEVRLLIDTGAFFSTLTPGKTLELGLQTRPAPEGFSLIGVGGLTIPTVTTIRDLDLDTIPLHKADFLVAGNEIDHDVAGVLGRNILSFADSEYDVANGMIHMLRPTGCGTRSLVYWSTTKPFSTLDILPSDGRFPAIIVPVTVNGVRLKGLLDSGAPATSLGASAARRVGIVKEGESVALFGGGIGHRVVHGSSGPIASVKIGDEEVKNTRLNIIDVNITAADMVIGIDFFLSHHIFVAQSQQKVYFTYNGGAVFKVSPVLLERATDVGADTPQTAPVAKADVAEPTDAAGFSRRGEAFAGRRNYPAAMADLDRAVALAPTNPDYVLQRAGVRLANEQVFLAMTDIDQTLKLRPGDPEALLIRAQLRFMGHDREAGLSDLDAIDKSASPAADVRMRLAGFYERWDRLGDAVRQYTLWIAAHPDDTRRAPALNGRCWARALMDQELDKALADCDAAHRAMPNNGNVLDSRGLVHLRLEHFDKALADYNAALAIQPKSGWTLYGRGLTKLHIGDVAGGRADMAAATVVYPKITTEAARRGLTPPPAP